MNNEPTSNPVLVAGTTAVMALAGAAAAGVSGAIVVGALVFAFIKLCCGGPSNDEPGSWHGGE